MKRNCDLFASLFDQYLEERGEKLEWSKIKPPPKGTVRCHLASHCLALLSFPRLAVRPGSALLPALLN